MKHKQNKVKSEALIKDRWVEYDFCSPNKAAYSGIKKKYLGSSHNWRVNRGGTLFNNLIYHYWVAE